MNTLIIAAIIGCGIGLLLTIWQIFRLNTGRNPKVIRNPDGTIAGYGRTMVLFFIMWSVVHFVLAFVVVFVVRLFIGLFR